MKSGHWLGSHILRGLEPQLHSPDLPAAPKNISLSDDCFARFCRVPLLLPYAVQLQSRPT
jgi:hypothetical protein